MKYNKVQPRLFKLSNSEWSPRPTAVRQAEKRIRGPSAVIDALHAEDCQRNRATLARLVFVTPSLKISSANNLSMPYVSIIMPVFNTGAYLNEAIASVLNQQSYCGVEVPDFELILVDDNSTDPTTLAILANAKRDARIRFLGNRRSKGAAGARNSGIDVARGEWIGFLDSDDAWGRFALAQRMQFIQMNSDARWVGARFKLWKPEQIIEGSPVFAPADALLPAADSDEPAEVKRLARPVEHFAKSCMVGIMTVLVQRSLLLEKGMFNESLPRSEDYHLWFKCAVDNDLFLLEAELALYRIHPASLTHGNAPRHLHEELMVTLLLADAANAVHKSLLLRRLDFVMQDHCFFYRRQRQYGTALRAAMRWIGKRPAHRAAWKELLAASLRRR